MPPLPGDRLRLVARRAVASAIGGLGREAAVHDVRRTLKVLRSLVVLIRPALGEAAYRRDAGTLRQVSKALAGPRRLDAMDEAASKLCVFATPGPYAGAAMVFGTAAAKLAETSRGAPIDRAALVSAMRQFRVRIAAWPLPPEDPSLFVKAAGRTLRKARRLTRKGLRKRHIETLHRGRTSLIHHLNHIRLMAEIGFPLDPDRLPRLEKLRGALGDLNDLDDVRALMNDPAIPLQYDADVSDLERLLRKRRKALLAKIARMSAVVLAKRPRDFERRFRMAWKGRGGDDPGQIEGSEEQR